ncbi:MAG TPA: hypothetical protein DCZ13_04285 [Porticoccaceae bacterium]|nr:hypothetical protein [Porticoccaceae bacterium]
MLVDDQPDRAAMVESNLKALGFEVVSVLSTASGLLYQMQQLEPHVIMIDIESPDRDILESLALINEHNPLPVVMFSNHEDPEFIQQAVRSGVSAYMTETLNPAKVRPILEIAIAQFERFQTLRRELDSTQRRLDAREVIEKAKRLLMKQQNLSEEQAYKNMRTLAMNNSQSLAQIAENIIAIMDSSPTETSQYASKI